MSETSAIDHNYIHNSTILDSADLLDLDHVIGFSLSLLRRHATRDLLAGRDA
jgi:hypothetical protein